MEKKIIKKILAILTVIMLMSTDFFVLGSGLISYAAEIENSTNNENIEFSTYFKNEKGEKVSTLQTSIKSENLKLYAEIAVKNDGYLNGALELKNSNFNIKNNILSDAISSIEGNKVNLKQINAGTTVVVELDIEPIISDTMSADMLLKASDLELTGTYMETSYKGLSISASKAVTLDLQADESTEAELETDIITNKVFTINGEDKRVVQLLIKSRLTENQYPIKQTIINVDIPQLSEKNPEKVEVLSLGTLATNGKTTLEDEDVKNENGKVQITLKNEDSEIKWNKDVYDQLVVTFIYAKDVDASKVEITTNSEITVHNTETKYTATYKKGIENQEPNGIVLTQAKINTAEIYKGQLYANVTATEKKDIEYNTTTTLEITNANIAEKITVKEEPDTFVTNSTELVASTKYIKTEINKAKMLEILGQDGNIEIKNGKTTTVINKDTKVDENGNIVVEYGNSSNELTITTSKPQKAGMLEIQHTKVITESTYTRAQLKTVKEIKVKNTVTGTITVDKEEQKVVENSTESSLELKETTTKAELTVNKENLSTMMTNNEVILGVKLITDGVQYDLYKNPKIKIQLPSAVESVSVNGTPSKLYADDFEIDAKYNGTTKTIEITLRGEQTEYPETAATQTYLQLNLNITLSKLTPSKADKIIMTYTNENATQYDGGTTDVGVVEKSIGISAPNGLITMHNSNTYNITGIAGTSENEQLVQLTDADAGKTVSFDIALVNNTGSKLDNVRILGKLPTEGNKLAGEENANTLATTLKNITAPNATIYYSENAEATADTENVSNGWTTTLNANAKVYLIKLETLNKESNYSASYSIQLPNPMTKDVMSYTEYKVLYDTEIESDVEQNSVVIGFVTPTELKIETGLSAQVGNDTINNGDTIKVGEVIRYTMTAKNNGAQTIKNVQLKSSIPEGTVYVTPEEGYQHSGVSYYTENSELKEVSVTIPTLAAGETYSETYEVRVKSDITAENQITNKAVATCEDKTVESTELTNKITPSNIRVTIKKLVEDNITLVSGGTMEYLVFVENLSENEITNLELQIVSNNFKITHLSDAEDLYLVNDQIPEKISINKIEANGNVLFKLEGNTTENTEEVSAIAVVKDSSGNTYRSNKCVDELQKVDAKISLSSPQDKAYLREGDTVEYNITVENTGNIDENITVVDNIPEYLDIKAIYVNGKVTSQTTETAKTETYTSKISNNISYIIPVAKGNKAEMTIIAKVKHIEENVDAKTITNKAEARVYQMTKSTSEEVSHILKITAEDLKNIITGKAWLDSNINGIKDNDETLLSGIKVILFDISTNDYAKYDNGNIIETTTNEKGEYTFTKVKNGKYLVLFEYDTNQYEPTYYLKDGTDESKTSKVVLKNITINGQEKTYAVTDTINLEDNISNINIGLKEKLIFDLELNKYISRIAIQNSKGTKSYDYENSTFEKVEISSKQLKGSVVVLEYTIKVKNNGEIAGYATNIVDYLSSGLTFSSELNPDWYLSGNNLYTKKLEGEKINPGEEKEVKLILTKTMTEENTGVVNNRAEIYDTYNEYGNIDINSTPANNVAGENDIGSADVIIGPATGGTTIAYIILIIINTMLIIVAIRLMIKNNIIKTKKERR